MAIKINSKYSFLIVLFILSINLYSQNNPLQENLKKLEVKIINEEINFSSSATLNEKSGFIVGPKGVININEGVKLTIAEKFTVLTNNQIFYGKGKVLFNPGTVDLINVNWFGAISNDGISDHDAIQRAIDAAISSNGVSVVYFPAGEYIIEKPLVAQKNKKDSKNFDFFNLTLMGHQLPYSNPKTKKGGVSVLKTNKELPFILGIQGARGVHVKNLVFDGFLSSKINIEDLIHKSSDELYKQEQFSPLSAIVIDPFSKNQLKEGGYKNMEKKYITDIASSRILIENSVIQNFPTGIAISPNGETFQADSINILYTRFSNLINGIVIGQTQSRNVVVDNGSFHRMKYAFNTDDFGKKTGVLPEVNNSKFADGVAWLYKANGNVSYGHFRNNYAEGLYGIGYSVINKQPIHFDNCVFKFRPMNDPLKNYVNPCVLKADNASFFGCTFTIGGGSKSIEPLMMDVKKATFLNCYLDTYPVNIGYDLTEKNKSDYINSNLRKNKIESANWKQENFDKANKEIIYYDSKIKSHYITNNSRYIKGDFVFGLVTLTKEPFNNEKVFTTLGKIESIKNNKAYFVNNLLEKRDVSLKIIEI